MCSKQDFEEIAKILARVRNDAPEAVDWIACAIAEHFEGTVKTFDKGRFLMAARNDDTAA